MTKTVFLWLLPIFLGAQVETKMVDSDWLTDYDTALEKAATKERNMLIYFTGSDWCPPCKMLKTDLFETDEFKNIAHKYVLLYIDLPRDRNLLSISQMQHNQGLFAKFNKRGVFPLLKIVSSSGTELDECAGYGMNGKIQAHLDLLDKYLE